MRIAGRSAFPLFGGRRRSFGSAKANAAAEPSETRPTTAKAQRQPPASAIAAAPRRPPRPPSVLPPMKRPIASPIAERSISSARYAIATAGTPESASPVSARSATSVVQSGEKEAASVAAPAAASEAVITVLRPSASDSVPAKTIAAANTPVAADSERLAAAGEIENAWAKPGISGWTQ